MLGFLTFVFIVAAVIGVLGIRIVKQQDVGIVETFVKFSRTINPGLNWIVPVIQRVRSIVSLQIVEIKTQVEIKTTDNMFVDLPVSIMTSPDVNNVEKAFYKLRSPEEQIPTFVLDAVRSVASGMKLQDLFSDRQKIAEEVKGVVADKLRGYGYQIDGVLVNQPNVPAAVQTSFNRVIAAEREAEAATKEGAAAKIKAEALAEAEANSQRIRAKGMADARETLARGLSESVTLLEGKEVSPDKVVEILVELNRLDVIRDVGQRGNTMIFDVANKSVNMESALLKLLQKHDDKK